MPLVFPDAPLASAAKRPLTEADAIDIWIQRWMRVRRKDIVRRYGCDPRRIYEIWEETRFPGSRTKALARLSETCPSLVERIDSGPHRRIPLRTPDPAQLTLFD
jgi:hypothetical protein